MYKNQLQELAQRSCFNLPSYSCVREGPDHAPRFKASVTFNGEIFEGPSNCTTLRQAEHAAAEVALKTLSTKGPSRSLAARVLDEIGVYKNLLQGTAHRAGLNLPVYTTVRSGPAHLPIFSCTVELPGMSFKGEPAKTKKQAEKNAAMAAWSALKKFPNLGSTSSSQTEKVDRGNELLKLKFTEEHKPAVKLRDYPQRRTKFILYSQDNFLSSSLPRDITPDPRLVALLSEESTHVQSQMIPKTSSSSTLSSKILPPQLNLLHSSTNLQESVHFPWRRKHPLINQNVSPPTEEHQKDEEGLKNTKRTPYIWPQTAQNTSNSNSSIHPQDIRMTNKPALCSMSHTIGSMPEMNQFSHHNLAPPVQVRSVVSVFAAPMKTTPFKKEQDSSSSLSPLRTNPLPQMRASRFEINQFSHHNLAPPVQIRSVVPVFAAPPLKSPQIKDEEVSVSSLSLSQTEEQQLSTATSMLRSLDL